MKAINPKVRKTTNAVPELRPNAAGIDIGETSNYVAVPQDRADEPVRRFGQFTCDLEATAAWLAECGVETVAMESTGIYWIPLFELLETHGFKVYLINSRHWRNLDGRKTDVCDSQWLQYLHSCGLLHASFRPDQQVCTLRSLLRHREGLVQAAASNIQLMQKSLTLMNLQLHNVISDITGKTGLAILDSILAGQRDPKELAELKDPRIKASKETIEKSLVGHSLPEHLFTLKQSLSVYRHYQDLIRDCDHEIEKLVSDFGSRIDPTQTPGSPESKSKTQRRNTLHFENANLTTEMYRLYGTNLTLVPGLGAQTICTLFSEIGRDLSAFASVGHFCSWMGLCPGNHITGGKRKHSKTRNVTSRVAKAFRLAAQGLWRNQSALGDFHRRMSSRLGGPAGLTATAHRLARIFYHLVTTGETYDESVYADEQERAAERRKRRLAKEARRLGYNLVQVGTE